MFDMIFVVYQNGGNTFDDEFLLSRNDKDRVG